MTVANSSTISDSAKAAIDRCLLKYPPEQKQSAVLWALTVVQEENDGFLTKALLAAVADYLDLPEIVVFEAATFYSMFRLQASGQYQLNVCTNISCKLCGAEKIMQHLQHRLGIKVGETTIDNKFSLSAVECLGACANAPMMQIGKRYYENLNAEKIDQLLVQLTKDER